MSLSVSTSAPSSIGHIVFPTGSHFQASFPSNSTTASAGRCVPGLRISVLALDGLSAASTIAPSPSAATAIIEWRNRVLRDGGFIVSSPEMVMGSTRVGWYAPEYLCARSIVEYLTRAQRSYLLRLKSLRRLRAPCSTPDDFNSALYPSV